MPSNPRGTPRKQRPDPVGPALGPDPDVGYIAAPAADRRRSGGGPASGGKGMRNGNLQPTDMAVLANRLRNG